MTDLKRMRDFCPHPSDAVRAMVKGLRTARDAKDFRVDMGDYGHVESLGEEKICYGCAATCAILESLGLWHLKIEYGLHRQERYILDGVAADIERMTGVAWDDLFRWERAVDFLRLSDPRWLCKYYGVAISQYATLPYLPCLTDSHSEAELQQYETFADALKTAGL